MAMGYIDREEAMRAIDEYKGYFQDQASTSNLLTKIEAKCIISDVDDADVEPVVHGKWDDSLDGITPYCSVCGCTHKCLIRTPLYCPNCGAKMDKED